MTTPVDSLANHLAHLQEKGFLPAGAVAKRDALRLQILLDAGVLREKRQGAGKRLVVQDEKGLQSFINSLYPAGLSGNAPTTLPPRSRAVATRRDAKKSSRGAAEALFLRGFDNACLKTDKSVLLVADLTRQAGVAALLLDDGMPAWSYDGIIMVVENLEVFVHLERLSPEAALVLYAGGRLSGRTLEWLSSSPMAGCRIIHCGDYDPVGLDEYLRLSLACPGRVNLYLPPNIEYLFKHYGKRSLVEKGQAILRRLRKSDDPAVRHVVSLMDRFGAGLEQEALLIGSASS